MSDRVDDEYEQWLRDSAVRQQLMYFRYGDREWDEIPRDEYFRTKISWYVFNKDYRDLLETKEKKERSTVDNAIVKLKDLSGGGGPFLLACIYVDILLKKDKTSCIIPILKTKIPNDDRIILYEVQSGRVYYGGWKAYEKENKLPPCWMCYPQEGTYQRKSLSPRREGRVLLNYSKSPSFHAILPIVDVISCIGGGLCTGVLVTSAFFPPLLILELLTLAAGTGVIGSSIYGMARGIGELHDRNTHEQSISLSDPDACRQWLNVILSSAGILTAGGSVAVKAVSLSSGLGTNFAVNSTAALRVAATVLRCLNVGISVTGIITIVIDLVIKYMNNSLQTSDLNTFVSLCLLICNIVISVDQAGRLIGIIADQPQRIRNSFNMVRNTKTAVIKTVIENVPWVTILDTITGETSMNILRNIGFERTAEMISSIKNPIRRCLREPSAANVIFGVQELYRYCFVYFLEIVTEVEEACCKMEKWFNVDALQNIVIGGRRIFRNSSSAVSLEITDEVDRVLDDIELLEPSMRNDQARNIVNVVNSMASEMNCESETEYLKMIELVCDRLRNVCNAELIVQRHKSISYLMTDQKKRELCSEILSQLQRSPHKKEIQECFVRERHNFSTIRKNLIFCKPVYQSLENSVYFFEKSSKSFTFSQFVHDAACELLGTDDLFGRERRKFHLHKYETIFCITDDDRSIIFNYEIDKKNGKVRGIAIMDDPQ